MKYSGIGGQAVMEGVMMRNGNKYAVAVRKPDHDIEVKTTEFKSVSDRSPFFKFPFVRGIVSFIESLYLGIKALTFSSSFYEDEEEKNPAETKKDGAATALTVAFSLLFAIVLFMIIPFALSRLFGGIIKSDAWLTAIEGLIRIVVLIAYIEIISAVEDIHRVYMYHGAEHKCINCVEQGLPLTVENVRKQTRRHKRCGTSFLLYVVLLSAVLFMFIRADNVILRLVFRIILVPVVASIVYEFIRIAGRYDNKIIQALAEPGLILQGLTTREPDDSMIEVGIKSVEAVFDWKTFIKNIDKPVKPVLTRIHTDNKKEVRQKAARQVKVENVEIESKNVAEIKSEDTKTENAEQRKLHSDMPQDIKQDAIAESNEVVPVIKRKSEEVDQEAVAAAKRRETAARVKPVKTLNEQNHKEEVKKKSSSDDDDEILNALDRFFNNEKAIENAKKAREDRSGRLR